MFKEFNFFPKYRRFLLKILYRVYSFLFQEDIVTRAYFLWQN